VGALAGGGSAEGNYQCGCTTGGYQSRWVPIKVGNNQGGCQLKWVGLEQVAGLLPDAAMRPLLLEMVAEKARHKGRDLFM
jgi:hypothetical protein